MDLTEIRNLMCSDEWNRLEDAYFKERARRGPHPFKKPKTYSTFGGSYIPIPEKKEDNP